MKWTPQSALAYLSANGLETAFYSRYPNTFGAKYAGDWAILWLEANGIFLPGNENKFSGAANVAAAVAESEVISKAEDYVMPFNPVQSGPVVFPPTATNQPPPAITAQPQLTQYATVSNPVGVVVSSAQPVFSLAVTKYQEDEDGDSEVSRPATTTNQPTINSQTLTLASVAQSFIGPVSNTQTNQSYTPLVDADEQSEIHLANVAPFLVGRDSFDNDVYQSSDANGVEYQWSVKAGDSYEKTIPGTTREITGRNAQASLLTKGIRIATVQTLGPNGNLPQPRTAAEIEAEKKSEFTLGNTIPKILGAVALALLTR